ncbi:MAG: helix-turn-helix domain containing protein [Candidatus Moranbacteria bacterium]|nr:helix-turn-helix domain containing protein [Candidatus Moranbacteria bacterium]
MKKDKKIEAIALRKQNKSYSEIAELLNISKSTVSYWFKDIIWSENIKKQLTKRAQKISEERLYRLNELKKKKWKKIYDNAETEAVEEFEKLKRNILFSTGISLYWGEGDKNFANGQVRVSNVDYKLLYVFNVFLQKICNVDTEKIKAYILMYPDLNSEECLKYWSKNIGITKDKFFKSVLIQGKHKTRKLTHGVCSICVSNKYLKKKILVWMDLFAKEF